MVYHLGAVEPGSRQGILLMLQGSGCDPVIERDWLQSDPPLLAPARMVVAIEKYGVSPGMPEAELDEGCSQEYWQRNTLQQRVVDAVQLIAHLRKDEHWNGELIIYGGSEGGAVAALLAPLVPETRAVIIESAGIGVSVGELIRSSVPPAVAAQIPSILALAKANPTGIHRFGGASYRWWADAMDVTPALALLQTDAPILLIHGARDSLAPVSTARATRDLFARARRTNLTYAEYPDYDHEMADSSGTDHRLEVLTAAGSWLESHSVQLRQSAAR
jgi:alpha-beta hydrolase superfamily lysophospholipase